jgi:hypothetical protein
LKDLNVGLLSNNLTIKERVRGLVTRIGVCSILHKDISEDMEEFQSICPDFPTYEVNDKRMIIRNVPDCEYFKETISKYLISSKFCEGQENIKIFSSGIMIIERMPNNDCKCKKQAHLNNFNMALSPKELQEYIDGCKGWCDNFKDIADLWCIKHLKKITCQTVCLLLVIEIKNWCYGCCSQGNFFRTCIEPYNDIAGRLDSRICKPDWD